MPTVIDSLIVKLGLDSSGLDAKTPAATKKTKELKESVKSVGSAGKEASKGLGELTRSLSGLLALIGGTYAIKAFIADTINMNAALGRVSQNLGLSVETVSAWGNAVEEVGGSAKGLQGTLDMLSKQQTQLRLTGESSLVPFFARLGVNIGAFGEKVRPVDEILLDLAERFGHMDRTQANNLGRLMGIDQDTLNLLLQGREAVELMIKRQKEHNAVTKAEAEQDAKWQRSIVQLNQSFNKFGRDLLQQAAPAIDKIVTAISRFGEWVSANREFVVDFLTLMAAGLAAVAVATLPITATTAAIVALAAGVALLYQDYQTWKRGGNSFVDWQVWKDRVDAVSDAISTLREKLKGLQKVEGFIDKVFNKLPGGKAIQHYTNSKDNDDATKIARLKTFFGIKESRGHAPVTAAQARKVAQRVSAQTGISADILFAQFAHETGNFTNRGSTSLNNLAGINVPGGRGKDYRDFNSPEAFADYYAGLLKKHYPKTLGAQDTDTFVNGLHNGTIGSYFGDTVANYEKGVNSALSGIKGASSTVAQASPGGASSTTNDHSRSVTTGDIKIYTAATDAQGIASDMNKSLNYLFVAQANSGLR